MQPQFFTEANKIWKALSNDVKAEANQLETDIKKPSTLFQLGDYYYLIFNVPETTFEVISEELTEVLGYSIQEITVPFFISKIHPEDQPWFLNFENKVREFFGKLKAKQVPNYKVQYDYRIRKSNDDYIRIMQQVTILQFTGENNITRTLITHTDISHIKKDGAPELSFIGLNGEPSYINTHVKNLFAEDVVTNREKEILGLLIKGYDSKSISRELYISKQTVDTHRKNLLRKTGCDNTAALTSTAIRRGWV